MSDTTRMIPISLRNLKDRIDARMNDHLTEMRPDYDDSIVGFNEAWDIVRKTLADLESEICMSKPDIGNLESKNQTPKQGAGRDV